MKNERARKKEVGKSGIVFGLIKDNIRFAFVMMLQPVESQSKLLAANDEKACKSVLSDLLFPFFLVSEIFHFTLVQLNVLCFTYC